MKIRKQLACTIQDGYSEIAGDCEDEITEEIESLNWYTQKQKKFVITSTTIVMEK